MKQAKGITSIGKTRKRVYDLQAWAPSLTFIPALIYDLLHGSLHGAVSVRNCVWLTERPQDGELNMQGFILSQNKEAWEETAWGCRQLHSHQKLGFFRLSVLLYEL